MRNWTTILLLGTQLYELIQKAEKAFGDGAGAQKFQQVLKDFGLFLETLAKSGQLSEKLSGRILKNTPVVIDAFVAILNVFEAWGAAREADKPEDPPPDIQPIEPPARSFYLRRLEDSEVPSDTDLLDGDEVYSVPWGDGTKRTYIRPAGDRSLLPGGAKLIRTIRK